MNRIVHFEIQADNPKRAAKFYREVFGWKIDKWDDPAGKMEYWMVLTAPQDSKELGINGGLLKRPGPAPGIGSGTNAFVCTIDVPDWDEAANKIEAAGGKIAMPKTAITGMAWQGYFLDTEGNVFGIHQVDKNAK
jgi:predicted enzyme related to lactoylglutathione lyase